MGALLEFERLSRRQLGGDDGYDKWQSLLGALLYDSGLFLDVVDFQLHRMDDDISEAVEDAKRLERILAEGGSAWAVVGRDGAYCLERRVPEEVAVAANRAMSPEDNASKHLRIAWGKVYGRNADPSGAYREAVKAVEAAAKPVVLPADRLATLGKMIARIEQSPDGFAMSLGPHGFNAIDGLVAMMRLLWRAQQDRHGTDDPDATTQVGSDEAEAALYVAVTLVQWFRSGAVAAQ
ncbi:MAG: hypothetical protein WAM81_09145 [Acidimicrobiia bacterium]